MNSSLAKYISIVFHPATIPTINYAIFLFFCADLSTFSPIESGTILLFVFCWTFLAPSSIIFLLYQFGIIPDLKIEDRKTRVLPLAILAIYFCFITGVIHFKGISSSTGHLFLSILYANTLGSVLSFLTSLFHKASIHAAASIGMCTHVIGLTFFSQNHSLLYPTIFCFIISGIIMSSRLALNAHSTKEIISGSLLGCVTNLIILFGYYFI